MDIFILFLMTFKSSFFSIYIIHKNFFCLIVKTYCLLLSVLFLHALSHNTSRNIGKFETESFVFKLQIVLLLFQPRSVPGHCFASGISRTHTPTPRKSESWPLPRGWPPLKSATGSKTDASATERQPPRIGEYKTQFFHMPQIYTWVGCTRVLFKSRKAHCVCWRVKQISMSVKLGVKFKIARPRRY